MQNKTTNDSFPDRFSDYMKRRLEDHQLSVDEDSWEVIETRLKKRNKSVLWWMGGLLAAAMVTGIIWMISLPSSEEFCGEERVQQLIESKSTELEKDIKGKNEPVLELLVAKTKKRLSTPALSVIQPIKRVEISEFHEENIVQEHDTGDVFVSELETEQASVTKEPKYSFYQGLDEIEVKKKKVNKQWLIAGIVGSGKNVSVDSYGMWNKSEPMDQNDGMWSGGIIPSIPGRPDGLQPEDFSDIDYSIPLSFGVTVRKNLTKSLALESGLVYTYLSTDFYNGVPHYEAQLKIHYLGVPANLVVYLWNEKKWNVYVSGGVTIEKGIRSAYTQRIFYPTEIRTTTARTSISGIQWSLNASAGASYRIYREWSLYIQPQLSYYFDNDQPISYRTDKPVSVGLAGGIRYEF